MQYRVPVPWKPTLTHLFGALAEWLPLRLDESAVAGLLLDSAASESVLLSTGGYVRLRAEADGSEPGSVWLQLDGNRRAIKTARLVCTAWMSAHGAQPAAADGEEAQATFLGRLAGVEKIAG